MPGPREAPHGILEWEREAIVDLFDEWGHIDRSHRKLAHRGSRLEKVFVSESTVLRVLSDQGLVLAATPSREPVGPRRPWPDWVEYRPCQVWGHDFTAFMRAGCDALAVLDLVSRKWIATLVVAHGRGTSEHVMAIYTQALDTEGLLAEVEARMVAPNRDEQLPVLLTVSDGGPQMISGTTREFMALHALAMHVGRPGTPTDQAHIESLFGHVKIEWPHLEHVRDPAGLVIELERVRVEYNTVRLHAGIGYVTPDDEHEQRGETSADSDAKASTRHEPPGSPTVATTNTTRPDHGGYFPTKNPSLTQKHLTAVSAARRCRGGGGWRWLMVSPRRLPSFGSGA